MTLPVGMILVNRYRLDGLLAHGGMGAIYKAFDTNLNIPVAIKENFFQTPESIQQFQQEALILARLRHPGLPRVIHHFSTEHEQVSGRKQYLVMDFIEGQDLWQIVQERGHPLEEKQALNYMIQVCDAVSYLHRQHPPIIHRDIKPQNIKITPDNRAMLVDFGIAKIGIEDTKTRAGAQGVTPGFSPPEQYSGAGTTPVSDVYSLGATLYAVLTGKKPPDSISVLVSKTRFEPPNVVNSALSNQVSEAVIHAMQPMVEDRPQSAAGWQEELQATPASLDTTPTDDEKETLVPGTVLAADPGQAAQTSGTQFWLVDSTGQGYPIRSEPSVIGRHSGADIEVSVLSVSRQHALIRAEEDHCLVMDNGSANGTFLNSQRLGLEWQPMKAGDVLMVGSARFHLTAEQPGQVVSTKSAPDQADGPKTEFDPSTPRVAPATLEMAAPVQPEPSKQPGLPPAPLPPVQAASAPPVVPQPVRQKRRGRLLVVILAMAVIFAGLAGAAAVFMARSAGSSSATATAGARKALAVAQTETAEAAELEAESTITSQAKTEAEATGHAASTRQTEEEAATGAAAIATQPTVVENTPTTVPTPTRTPTAPPPTATPTQTPKVATPTKSPATATATATQSPTSTAAPAPAGPTVIPLKSDVSIPQIGVREVTDVDINLKNPREVYVLVKGDGIYKSSNGGKGPWAKIDVDASAVTSLMIDPANPARLFAPTWNAVLRSDDGGNTWKAFGNGLSAANRVVDVVTIDPADPNILYAGIGETLVVSTDSGESWVSEQYGNGLSGGRFTNIVVDPFNHDIVYAAGEFGSIYKSVDSGRNFLQLSYGTGRGTYALIAHPNQRDIYLAGINSYDAGIIKTENGGDFVSVSNGLVFGGADSAYSAMVFAPGNPNIIYAGSGYEDDRYAKGIFKSTNGGKNWERVSDGLNINPATNQPHYVKSMVVHPANPNIALAATGGGLFMTVDGGEIWNLQ